MITKALLTLFALTGSVVLAQQSPPAPQQQERQSSDTTLVGCLTTTEAGQYLLTDSRRQMQIVITNGAAIQKHVNHLVKIVGTPSEDGQSVTVTKIQMVAATCQQEDKQDKK